MTGLQFTAHGATDVGRVREGNEDSYFVGTTVFAVADGMGGHVAGEVASKRAIEPVAELNGTAFTNDEGAQKALVDAIAEANRLVIADATEDPQLSGMGTTLTAVMLRNGRLHLAHVGDSRAYLLREGEAISQLTTDHTLVEQLVREGRISREEAAVHPQRNVITKTIGINVDVEIDSLAPLALEPGDQVLLCSDGLTGPVSDDLVTKLLRSESDGDRAIAKLIDAANANGGQDNITAVLLKIDGFGALGAATTADAADRPGSSARPSDATDTLHDGDSATPIRTREPSEDPAPDDDWATKMGQYASEGTPDDGKTKRRRFSKGLALLLGLAVLLAVLGGGGYWLLARAYFVGDADGHVTIFNGLPSDNVGGLSLNWEIEVTDLETDDLPDFRANRVREGVSAASLAEAREIIERFAEDLDDEEADPSPSPSPSPTDSPSPGASPGDDDTSASPSPDASPSP